MKKILYFVIVTVIFTYLSVVFAVGLGDYRSKAGVFSTVWNSASNWETWDGSAWVPASSFPNSSTAVVEIFAGHNMELNTNPTVKDLTVNGALVNTSGSLTGIFLDGNLICNGTILGSDIVFVLDGSGSLNTISGSGTITLQYLTKTLAATNTYTLETDLTLVGTSNLFQNVNSSGNQLSFNIDNGGILTIPNAIDITGTSNVILNFSSGAGSSTVIYSKLGNQNIYPNTYKTLVLSGSGVKTLGSSGTVNTKMSLQGTATFSGGVNLTWGSGATLEYAGSSAQIFSSEEWITAPPSVTINNVNDVSLSSDISVNTVNIIDGNLKTWAYALTVNVTSGGVNGETAGHYILGTLKTNAVDLTTSAAAFSNIGLTFSTTFTSGNSVILTRTTGAGFAATVGGIDGFDRVYQVVGSGLSYNGTVTCDWFGVESQGRNLLKVDIWEYNSTSGTVWENRGPNAAAVGSYSTTSSINTNVSGVSIIKYTISDDANPLPVELTSFTAKVKSKAIILNWETATEVNNYGFEIERTTDKVSEEAKWEKIGFVEGHGNSSSPKSYSFADDSHIIGKVHYRLKQVDTDGAFEYSDVVTVTSTDLAKYELFQNHPNPFNPSTVISFSLPKMSHVKLTVYNAIGQEVAKLVDKVMEAGYYNVTFDGSNLATGLYIYRLETTNYSKVMKMRLVK